MSARFLCFVFRNGVCRCSPVCLCFSKLSLISLHLLQLCINIPTAIHNADDCNGSFRFHREIKSQIVIHREYPEPLTVPRLFFI